MASRRILWQLYLPFLLITLAVLLVFALYNTRSYREDSLRQVEENLATAAKLLHDPFTAAVTGGEPGAVDALCKNLGSRIAGFRLTVVLPGGEVAGDSAAETAQMENHAGRTEIEQVLRGAQRGVSLRLSDTLNERFTYVAIPLAPPAPVAGASGARTEMPPPVAVLRVSRPLTTIDAAHRRFVARIYIGCLVVAVVAALVGLFVSRRITRPLAVLREGAERYAKGEFEPALPIPSSLEIGALASAMNQMAAQIKGRFEVVRGQRRELEALLSSMEEGVIAVDPEERILNFNQSAKAIFGVGEGDLRGRPLSDVVRNPVLQSIITESFETGGSVEREFPSPTGSPEETVFNAHGAPWLDRERKVLGVVVVITDITRLSRLENVRKDFVANVSHELKTPITSIRGYAETLLAGAHKEEEDALRFLDVIVKQSTRLQDIIEDLLELSRMEQGPDAFPFEPGSVGRVIESAADICRLKAEEKDTQIELDCPEDILAPINPALLEQALVNLIVNGIKYSDPGSLVKVSLRRVRGGLEIRVQDEGIGIPEENLPRLFERFFRVDKARSRKLGGTGLGLSIVKHITLLHKGNVSVQSQTGRGSTFTLFIPVPEAVTATGPALPAGRAEGR